MEPQPLYPTDLERLGCRLRQVLPRMESPASSLQWSPDGNSLVVTNETPQQEDQQTNFWDWREPTLWLVLDTRKIGACYWPDLTWSPNGRSVAVSAMRFGPAEPEAVPFPSVRESLGVGLGVEVRQIVGPPRVHFIPFESPDHVVNCVSWFPKDSRFAVAADRRLRIFDAATGEEKLNLDDELVGSVIGVCFSPSQPLVAVASDLGEIKLLDASTWQENEYLMVPDLLFTIQWSPDGSTLAAATQNGPVLLYTLGRTEPVHILEGHSLGADRISFSADGNLLASIGRDMTLRLWDTNAGQELLTFSYSDLYFPTMWVFHPHEMVAAVWNQHHQQVEIWEIPATLGLSNSSDALAVGDELADLDWLMGEEFSVPEGQRKLRLHIEKERNKKLVKLRKQRGLAEEGCLRCAACGFIFAEFYGDLGADFIECHHTKPVAELEPGEETNINDLVLVCSNCHRMLHRGKSLLTVSELQALMRQQKV